MCGSKAKHLYIIPVVLALGMLAGNAYADVFEIGSQGVFSASGTIVQNTNWDSYGAGFFYPGSPFTVGALTFVEGGQNMIGGVGTSYNLARNLFTDNFIQGTTAFSGSAYNLFGFNAGNFFGDGNTAFVVTTNLNTYNFSDPVGTATNGAALSFHGFQATGSEYFTSVHWYSDQATGITDVQLGTAVPDGGTTALLLGLAVAGVSLLRRRLN